MLSRKQSNVSGTISLLLYYLIDLSLLVLLAYVQGLALTNLAFFWLTGLLIVLEDSGVWCLQKDISFLDDILQRLEFPRRNLKENG